MQNLPNLPKAWEFRTLGEVCEITMGQSPLGKNLIKKNQVANLSIETLEFHQGKIYFSDKYISESNVFTSEIRKIAQANSVLLCVRAPVGVVNITQRKIAIGRGLCALNSKIIDNEFLYFYLLTKQNYFNSKATGTTFSAISLDIVKNAKIPLPPIDEQKRIVKIIDEKFAKIDKGLDLLLENKELLRKYKLSLLKSAFDGKLVSNSKNWEIKTLGEVFLIERGGSPRPIKSFLTKEANGINWIKIGDASNSSKYIYQTAEKIKPEGKKRSRFVEIGDLILSNSMSFGRPYIMKTTGCIHDGWVVLRNSKKMIDEEFAYYVLTSSQIYAEFSKLAAGSTVKNLSIDRIKQVKIPLPPIDEQKRIVKIIDAKFKVAEALEKLNDENIQNFKLLKKAILKDAFKSGLKG